MTSQTFARMLRSELDDVVDFFEQLKGADLDEALTESDYPGGRPWSARDHLAHLVQREVDFLPVARRVVAKDPDPVRLAHRGATPEERTLFVNRENQEAVDRRRSQSLSQLVAELTTARMELVSIVSVLSQADLDRTVTVAAGRNIAAVELLAGSVRHARAHLEMLAKVQPDRLRH